MRKILALLLSLLVTPALAGGIPAFPGGPMPDTVAILNAINTWVQSLNGVANNFITSPGVVSSGAFCTATGVTPQTCNAQRGLVTTGTLTTAAATNANFVINNNLLTTQSICEASVVAYSGTLVTNGYPTILIAAAGTGTLTASITNVHPTNALNGTVGIGFACFN